jgi:hypothetical protein
MFGGVANQSMGLRPATLLQHYEIQEDWMKMGDFNYQEVMGYSLGLMATPQRDTAP